MTRGTRRTAVTALACIGLGVALVHVQPLTAQTKHPAGLFALSSVLWTERRLWGVSRISGSAQRLRNMPPPRKTTAQTGGIVLFDGTCAFCEGAVTFIAARDPAGYFRFGASQTPAAEALLAAHGVTRESARSLILIEGGQVFLRSTASLRVARRLVWPWSLLGVFLLVPAPLRDPFYRLVAAVRHRLAGRSNACELPPPEIRSRMIES